MAKSVIINLMSLMDPESFLGIDKEEYLNQVREEYLKNTNKSIVVYIILLCCKLNSDTSQLIVQKKDDDKFTDFPVSIDGIDIGNVDTLAALLKQIPELFESRIENKILVSWGHAMGYSMFFKIQPGDKFLTLKFDNDKFLNEGGEKKSLDFKLMSSILSPLIKNGPGIPGFSDARLLNDFDSKVSALTINELSEAIEKIGVIFDLMVFDNCFLQNVDTFFALKDITRYVIAPQTGFPWRGYDYSFFNNLDKKIDGNFCDLFCKESFTLLQKTNLLINFKDDFNSDNITFSWISTEKANEFFTNLEAIIDFFRKYFINDEAGVIQAIYIAARSCTDMTKSSFMAGSDGFNLVDLKYLLFQFDKNFKKNRDNFDSYYKKLMELYQLPIMKTYSGSIPAGEANGISIFFPTSSNGCYKSSYYGFFVKEGAQIQSAFSKQFKWGHLVIRIVNRFP